MEKYLGGFPVNSIRVCVDEQEKDEIQGTICGVGLEQELPFYNMTNLILVIEEALNRLGTPQAYFSRGEGGQKQFGLLWKSQALQRSL